VPYTAGGSVDANARLVAQRLSERLKQSVVIDNVGGAGGAVGLGKAAAAAPDGYTLVAGTDSAMAIGKLVNPAAYRFDPLQALAPVGMLNTAPLVLVAGPRLTAQDLCRVRATGQGQARQPPTRPRASARCCSSRWNCSRSAAASS
jgi:tripartite-type tricarboxylate transporter receptor subunit TctC